MQGDKHMNRKFSLYAIPAAHMIPNTLQLVIAVTGSCTLCESESSTLAGIQDTKTRMLEIIEKVSGIGGIVIDIITTGVYLPGEVILWVFGWAELENRQITAPHKWFYCMFAVACFLGGIELFKLFSIRFIVWTKR